MMVANGFARRRGIVAVLASVLLIVGVGLTGFPG